VRQKAMTAQSRATVRSQHQIMKGEIELLEIKHIGHRKREADAPKLRLESTWSMGS
jgi:hypothetical protein